MWLICIPAALCIAYVAFVYAAVFRENDDWLAVQRWADECPA